jgi:serine protease AprX
MRERGWLVLTIATAAAACGAPDEEARESSSFTAQEIWWTEAGVVHVDRSYPDHFVTYDWPGGEPPLANREIAAPIVPEVLDPELLEQLRAADPDDLVWVMVQVRPPRPLRELPPLVRGEKRDSPANRQVMALRTAIFDEDSADYFASQEPVIGAVTKDGGRMIERHVLCNCFEAMAPVDTVWRLAARADVVHIEPERHAAPMQDANPNNDEEQARFRMSTDLYVNAGFNGNLGGWWVGIVDSGVRASHQLLANPDRIDWLRDCVNGGANCDQTQNPGYNTGDVCVGQGFTGHGTSVASIVGGTNALGIDFEGVSDVWMDSWRIFGAPSMQGNVLNCWAPAGAMERGVDRAAWAGDDVVNVSGGVAGTSTDAFSTAADTAFTTYNQAVFAANGNGTLNQVPAWFSAWSPARAHKAFGVGAYDVDTLAQYPEQLRGPSEDFRIKPDVQGPYNVETGLAQCAGCSGATCDQCVGLFGGTSSATPQISGAAIVLKHFLWSNGLESNAGNMYAGLLASGNSPGGFPSNITGSGPTVLGHRSRTCGMVMEGSGNLSQGQLWHIYFNRQASHSDLRAAIWYPEGTNYHNQLYLYLYDPNGNQVMNDTQTNHVWHVVERQGSLGISGNWRITIQAFNVPVGPQKVYYYVFNRQCAQDI